MSFRICESRMRCTSWRARHARQTSLALLSVMLPCLLAPRVVQAQADMQWTIGGDDARSYEMTSRGSALLDEGATLTLQSKTKTTFGYGMVMSSIPVGNLAGKRVRISADIETKDIDGRPAIWLRADSGSRRLILRNSLEQKFEPGMEGAVRTTPRIEAIMDVPSETTLLTFGLMINGGGAVTARNVKITTVSRLPTAPAAQLEFDSAFSLVKRTSLWRDTVTWSRVEPLVRAMAAGAQSAAEVAPAIRELLNRLGDNHSFLMPSQRATEMRSGAIVNPRPVIRVQADSIGYISVPAYGGGDKAGMESYVRDVYDLLSSTVASGAGTCRWIVDVRANNGGNMWPMLGGLRPFLGDVGLGAFVQPEGSGPLWKANTVVNITVPGTLAPLETANVAMLTGLRTLSSGEAVTISFKGRARTRSFGLPTGGLSTANTSTLLPSGALLVLTTAVEADRNGKRYGYEVMPDEIIGMAASGSARDPQMDRAITWLNSQSCR